MPHSFSARINGRETEGRREEDTDILNASGAIVWTATYTPFGGVYTATGALPPKRFAGQWFQSESGLQQNWMRDCDPTMEGVGSLTRLDWKL